MKILFLCICLMGMGVAGAHFRFLSPFLGFLLALGAVALLGLNGLFLSVLLLVRKSGGFTGATWLSLLFGIAAIAAIGFLVVQAQKNPLNDISTDTRTPPKFLVPRLKARIHAGGENLPNLETFPMEYSAQNVSLQETFYQGISPLFVDAPPTQVVHGVFLALKTRYLDWKFLLEDEATLHLEAEVETQLFRFVDDIVVEVRAEKENPEHSNVHVRSKSRYGKSDFGANANRISEILTAIRADMPKIVEDWNKKSREDKDAILRLSAKKTNSPSDSNKVNGGVVTTVPVTETKKP